MEPAEQPVELYDFLYRDPSRISSYYAQLFNGRLTGIEKNTSERSSKDLGAGINAFQVVRGDVRRTDETTTQQRETIDPDDVIAVDVLARLKESGILREDIEGAPNSSLIMASGILLFIDRHMLEMAVIGLDAALEQEKRKPKQQQNKEMLAIYPLVKKFVASMVLPSAFMLETAAGKIVGTIKEDGMEEPIPSYYFKHGTAGLSGVYVIGIKEQPSLTVSLPNTDLIGIGRSVAQALTTLMFPEDAIRITPIALFRKIVS